MWSGLDDHAKKAFDYYRPKEKISLSNSREPKNNNHGRCTKKNFSY